MVLLQHLNMQAHEDLGALAASFSRNMSLEEPKPRYMASMHYNHSSHVTSAPPPAQPHSPQQTQQLQPQPTQRPMSEPPQPEHPSAETILVAHGVDASVLSASQIELFKAAGDPQKLRLIELWRIAPPAGTTDNPALTWSNTTMEQEETMARLRYERNNAGGTVQPQPEAPAAFGVVTMSMSLDGTPVPTPVPEGMQRADGRWDAQQGGGQGAGGGTYSYMEPYMAAGYFPDGSASTYSHFGGSDLAAGGGQTYTPATDPVYRGSGTDWARQQQMENQYGALMMARESGEMEL